ncbi:MAG: ABC transporter substrate-binding protein [Clostridia bacterium]|nr:ABC transporter substrate-binding protein [Clostridia bacterium]
MGWLVGFLAVALLLTACGAGGPAGSETGQGATTSEPGSETSGALPHVTIAVGGASCLCYMPVVLANQLGFYKEAGVDAELVDFQGGSKALAAVLGGSADVVSGYYDHTVELAAKGKAMQAFVVFDQFPGLVLAVAPKNTDKIKSVADLKGKTVGVTAPGSSTDFFLKYVIKQNGGDPAETSVVGIGAGSTAVAAMEQGQVDAAVLIDPDPTLLKSKYPDLRILVDTRTKEDTERVLGGDYPAGSLYTTAQWVQAHRDVAQKLALAIVKTLQWIHTHTPEEIMQKMPTEYTQGNPDLYLAALKNMLPMYSSTGLMDPKGAEAVLNVFAASDEEVRNANIDVTKTYDNSFAQKADEQLGIK